MAAARCRASSKRIETPRSSALRRASAIIAGAKSTPVTRCPRAASSKVEKAGAAAGVERVERGPAAARRGRGCGPRRRARRRADAVAEILVEGRRPPVPVGGDLLLDGGSRPDGAPDYIFSISSIWAPSGASRKQTRRPLVGGSSSRMRTPLAFSLASVARVVVGVHGHVLDAVLLLAALVER